MSAHTDIFAVVSSGTRGPKGKYGQAETKALALLFKHFTMRRGGGRGGGPTQ